MGLEVQGISGLSKVFHFFGGGFQGPHQSLNLFTCARVFENFTRTEKGAGRENKGARDTNGERHAHRLGVLAAQAPLSKLHASKGRAAFVFRVTGLIQAVRQSICESRANLEC